MESRILQGVWWLPDAPDEKVAGTLTYRVSENPSVELIGSLHEGGLNRMDFTPEIVLGIVTGGKPITLYRVQEVQRTMNIGASGLVTSRLDAEYAIIGAHLPRVQDIAFTRFAVAYDRLGQWARLSGFTLRLTHERDTQRFLNFGLDYVFPEAHEINVQDFEVRFVPRFDQGGDIVEEVRLKQTMYYEVRAPEPRTLHWFKEIFYHLRNFVVLGVGGPVYPQSMRATLSVEKHHEGSLEHTREVEILERVDREDPIGSAFNPKRMLFGFGQIRADYSQALNNWFEKAETLRPVYDLYFATLYNPSGYGESRFLSLAQAVETYHRRVMQGTYLPNETYSELEAKLAEAVAAVPMDADSRKAFKGKLQYLNELSLRRRVRSLVKFFGDQISTYIPNSSRFAGEVVDTRNYLTHYNQSLQSSAATGIALYLLTEQLRLLLELCFLHEIGLPQELRGTLVSSHERYIRLQRMLQTHGAGKDPQD